MNHFVTVVLLLSVGIRCLVAEPCARLYVQGLHATNYPQLAGVYVLQTALPAEVTYHFLRLFCHPSEDYGNLLVNLMNVV